jgi:hypothetical protein
MSLEGFETSGFLSSKVLRFFESSSLKEVFGASSSPSSNGLEYSASFSSDGFLNNFIFLYLNEVDQFDSRIRLQHLHRLKTYVITNISSIIDYYYLIQLGML